MDIIKIAAIGIIASIIIVILKQDKPEIAILIGVAASVCILILLINYLTEVIGLFTLIVDKTGIDTSLFSGIIKIIGVGYITEFAAGICEDSGNKGLGEKISLGGKVIILVLSLPILIAVIDVIINLIP